MREVCPIRSRQIVEDEVGAAGKICKKEELRVVYHGRVRERDFIVIAID